jgi:hypothetical protein
MIDKGRGIKLAATLPRRHGAVLAELAEERFDGNVSATLRELLDTHPVTKSRLALPTKTTTRAR